MRFFIIHFYLHCGYSSWWFALFPCAPRVHFLDWQRNIQHRKSAFRTSQFSTIPCRNFTASLPLGPEVGTAPRFYGPLRAKATARVIHESPPVLAPSLLRIYFATLVHRPRWTDTSPDLALAVGKKQSTVRIAVAARGSRIWGPRSWSGHEGTRCSLARETRPNVVLLGR